MSSGEGNESGLNNLPHITQSELLNLVNTGKDIPKWCILDGIISAELLHELSNQSDGEIGIAVTTTKQRVLFRGDKKENTPSPLAVLQKLGEKELSLFLHIHVPTKQSDGSYMLLKAPSSSDFRVSNLSGNKVKTEILVADGKNIEYRSGGDYLQLESRLFFMFRGKNEDEFTVSDDEVNLHAPELETSDPRFEETRREIMKDKALDWYIDEHRKVERDPKENARLCEFIRDKLMVGNKTEAKENSYTRYLPDAELEELLNP